MVLEKSGDPPEHHKHGHPDNGNTSSVSTPVQPLKFLFYHQPTKSVYYTDPKNNVQQTKLSCPPRLPTFLQQEQARFLLLPVSGRQAPVARQTRSHQTLPSYSLHNPGHPPFAPLRNTASAIFQMQAFSPSYLSRNDFSRFPPREQNS